MPETSKPAERGRGGLQDDVQLGKREHREPTAETQHAQCPAVIATGFDYSALTADVASEVRAAASRVQAACSKAMTTLLDIGKELLVVKERLDHGQFGAWLTAEFGWSIRSAQNYMLAAECFGDKYETVALLQPATVYALAAPSMPDKVRDQVVAGLSSGELKPEDVGDVVRQARINVAVERKAEAAKRRRAKMTPGKLKLHLGAEKRREAELQRYETERGRQKIILDKLVILLRAKLGDEDKKWLAEATGDLEYGLKELAQRVCAT